jgi:hypothetical protein
LRRRASSLPPAPFALRDLTVDLVFAGTLEVYFASSFFSAPPLMQ